MQYIITSLKLESKMFLLPNQVERNFFLKQHKEGEVLSRHKLKVELYSFPKFIQSVSASINNEKFVLRPELTERGWTEMTPKDKQLRQERTLWHGLAKKNDEFWHHQGCKQLQGEFYS